MNFPSSFGDDLKKLINNTFCRHVVTDSYETALKISKEYHLTCVTSEAEIVYSEGYLCKVGHEEKFNDPKLVTFQKYYHKLEQESNKLRDIEVLNRELVRLQNAELEISRTLKSV